jgi:hypothetical protein
MSRLFIMPSKYSKLQPGFASSFPAQGGKERVEKLLPELHFVVLPGLVGFTIPVETLDQSMTSRGRQPDPGLISRGCSLMKRLL